MTAYQVVVEDDSVQPREVVLQARLDPAHSVPANEQRAQSLEQREVFNLSDFVVAQVDRVKLVLLGGGVLTEQAEEGGKRGCMQAYHCRAQVLYGRYLIGCFSAKINFSTRQRAFKQRTAQVQFAFLERVDELSREAHELCRQLHPLSFLGPDVVSYSTNTHTVGIEQHTHTKKRQHWQQRRATKTRIGEGEDGGEAGESTRQREKGSCEGQP